MRRIVRTIFACVVLVTVTIILVKTPILENIMSILFRETPNSNEEFYEKWYFNTLSENEKEVYLKIDSAVNVLDDSVTVIGNNTLSTAQVEKAYEAYLLDNPEVFYISNKYLISKSEVLDVTKIEIKLQYIMNDKVISKEKQKFNKKVDDIIAEVTNDNMTDFEKEIALHDYLIRNVKYYNYTNIDDIPIVKHSPYGALLEGEAVCDGIAEVYSVLLGRCGINSIVVTGKIEESHAWNKVKLENEWYNVDVTLDACGKNQLVSHVYFNLSDNIASDTYSTDLIFNTPVCASEEYNYYTYNNFEITNKSSLHNQLKRIIKDSNGMVLEFRIVDDVNIQDIVQELYNINFNNYMNNNVKQIEYFKIKDVVVIPKENV